MSSSYDPGRLGWASTLRVAASVQPPHGDFCAMLKGAAARIETLESQCARARVQLERLQAWFDHTTLPEDEAHALAQVLFALRGELELAHPLKVTP